MGKIKFLDGTEKEFETLVGANIEGTNLRWANLEGVDLRWANLEGVDLRGVNLEGANLYGANLRGANLRWANLYGTHLEGVNLEGANLYGANLRGAKLEGATNIISFTYGQHLGIFVIDAAYVKIGCEGHSLSYWLENYEGIGQENNYDETTIKMYGMQLKLLAELKNG